jgi:nucleotide-binding universal stress UspA family protein
MNALSTTVDETERAPRITTILVGVDGSPESDRAAAFATKLAIQLDAEIVAAHAVGLLDVWPEHPEAGNAHNSHEHVVALMEGPWTETIRRLGIRRRIALLDGSPGRVLLELADQIDADLIVVGSRGAGEAELFGLGDTSTKLAHRSACPILIVPPPRPADDPPLIESSQR